MTIVFDDFMTALPMATKAGEKILGKCVFHDDSNPSLLVFKDGYFKCLGCNKYGTWETLWNKLQGQPVSVQAERTIWQTPKIANENLEEVCYQAHEDLLQFSSYQWYLKMRGISERIETAEIGYWYGWYTFPIRDNEGNFKTAVFRAAPHIQEVTGQRYWIPSGKPTMYVPDWRLIEKSKYIFVVFGIFDALVLNDLRMPVVTSTSGNNTFRPEWLDGYRKRVYIIPDQKEEKVAIKLASALGWRGSPKYLTFPDKCKDPADFYKNDKKEELRVQLMQIGDY